MKHNEGRQITAEHAKAMRLDAPPMPASLKNLRNSETIALSSFAKLSEFNYTCNNDSNKPHNNNNHFTNSQTQNYELPLNQQQEQEQENYNSSGVPFLAEEFSFISFDSQEELSESQQQQSEEKKTEYWDEPVFPTSNQLPLPPSAPERQQYNQQQRQKAPQTKQIPFVDFTEKDIGFTISDEEYEGEESTYRQNQYQEEQQSYQHHVSIEKQKELQPFKFIEKQLRLTHTKSAKPTSKTISSQQLVMRSTSTTSSMLISSSSKTPLIEPLAQSNSSNTSNYSKHQISLPSEKPSQSLRAQTTSELQGFGGSRPKAGASQSTLNQRHQTSHNAQSSSQHRPPASAVLPFARLKRYSAIKSTFTTPLQNLMMSTATTSMATTTTSSTPINSQNQNSRVATATSSSIATASKLRQVSSSQQSSQKSFKSAILAETYFASSRGNPQRQQNKDELKPQFQSETNSRNQYYNFNTKNNNNSERDGLEIEGIQENNNNNNQQPFSFLDNEGKHRTISAFSIRSTQHETIEDKNQYQQQQQSHQSDDSSKQDESSDPRKTLALTTINGGPEVSSLTTMQASMVELSSAIEMKTEGNSHVISKGKNRTIFKISSSQPQSTMNISKITSQTAINSNFNPAVTNSCFHSYKEFINEHPTLLISSNSNEEQEATTHLKVNQTNNFIQTSPSDECDLQLAGKTQLTSAAPSQPMNRTYGSANRLSSASKSMAVTDRLRTGVAASDAGFLVEQKSQKLPVQQTQSQQFTSKDSLATTAMTQITPRVFCMNSQDDHMRRAMLKRGWKESRVASGIFDLKWIYIDSTDDYKLLQDHQYYNHFRNNQELTSKGRLLHNLKNYAQLGVDVDDFFPRCYDLGTEADRSAFAQQYHRINMYILVENHLNYCRLRRPKWVEEIENAYNAKLISKSQATHFDKRERLFQKNKRKHIIHTNPIKYEELTRDNTFIVNITIIAAVIEQLRRIKAQSEDLIDETNSKSSSRGSTITTGGYSSNTMNSANNNNNENYNGSNQSSQQLARFSFASSPEDAQLKFLNWVSMYVRVKCPFNEEKFLYDKIPNMGKEFWQTPSKYLIRTLYKLHRYFKEADPQFQAAGFRNIWIIKPSSNSRGQGISLVERLEDAIESGLQMSARIVQKYIERPLIFPANKAQKYGVLSGHKFDIRQWVLVRSVQPLRVYYFKNSYLRVCSGSFDLENTKNLAKHLTNFSVNKHAVKKENWDETVVELASFATLLKAFKNVDYYESVEPQIKELVITTLKAGADRFVSRNRSFELLGFDILLDEDTRPWLLEVNMSPACAERAPFLTKMLDEMAETLLSIIVDEEDAPSQESRQTAGADLSEESPNPNTWEFIYDEINDDEYQADTPATNAALGHDPAKNMDFFVVGHKVDAKKERALDRKYFQYWAAIAIQTRIRQFLAYRKLIFLRRTKHAIVIQKYARRFLCVLLKIQKREYRASTKIQSVVRRCQAMHLLVRLRRERAAIRIQCWTRMLVAKQTLIELIRVKCATKIQAKWRSILACRISNKRRRFMSFMRRIQLLQRAKFNKKSRACIQIQSAYRRVLAIRKLEELRLRFAAAIKIQREFKCFSAKQKLERLRIKTVVSRIYFKHKKKLLSLVIRAAKLRKFAAFLGAQIQIQAKEICFNQLVNVAHKRHHAAIRIQGMLKIKRAKRQKKRNYRLRLLIKVQRRFRAFRLRLRFLRYLTAKGPAAMRIQSFLRICVAKRKLQELRAYDRLENPFKYKQSRNRNNYQFFPKTYDVNMMLPNSLKNGSSIHTVFNNYYDTSSSNGSNSNNRKSIGSLASSTTSNFYSNSSISSNSVLNYNNSKDNSVVNSHNYLRPTQSSQQSRQPTQRKTSSKHQQSTQSNQFTKTFSNGFKAPILPPKQANILSSSHGMTQKSSTQKNCIQQQQKQSISQQQFRDYSMLRQEQQQNSSQLQFRMNDIIRNYDADEDDEELIKFANASTTVNTRAPSMSNNSIQSFQQQQYSISKDNSNRFQPSIPITRRPSSNQ